MTNSLRAWVGLLFIVAIGTFTVQRFYPAVIEASDTAPLVFKVTFWSWFLSSFVVKVRTFFGKRLDDKLILISLLVFILMVVIGTAGPEMQGEYIYRWYHHFFYGAFLLGWPFFDFMTLLSYDSYRTFKAENDTLLTRMQTPEARAAADTAFNASPEELGDAAVKGAKRKKSDLEEK